MRQLQVFEYAVPLFFIDTLLSHLETSPDCHNVFHDRQLGERVAEGQNEEPQSLP